MKTVRTPTLEIAYEESGPAGGPPVMLLHGFPDDVRAYDGVAPSLAEAGWRVIVPYLRGYGPTRFLDPRTPRSGQQAALGADVIDLLDALAPWRPDLTPEYRLPFWQVCSASRSSRFVRPSTSSPSQPNQSKAQATRLFARLEPGTGAAARHGV